MVGFVNNSEAVRGCYVEVSNGSQMLAFALNEKASSSTTVYVDLLGVHKNFSEDIRNQ